MNKPLAERMRPKSLEDYVGQTHLVGEKGILRKAIESGNVPSFILWGPPGVGKTTLAFIISQVLERPFFTLSAINSGVKDIRETIAKAKSKQFFNRANPILFIDEIHRFSKSQQDSLLGAVEKGIITLIGATTENPSFEVISALLSRAQVYILNHLSEDELIGIINHAISKDEILREKDIKIEEYEALIRLSGGDARKLLNVLEIVVNANTEKRPIYNELVQELIQENLVLYDKGGDQHYDTIRAFIKSIRGSDPNAAVYYLARMLEGGEDIKFIARRLLILASEDIGLANPNALLMANTAMQAVQNVGMPESRIILSQATIYLANSEKSNSAYVAINKAQAAVRQTGNLPVPLQLRNAPTQLMKNQGYGKGYKYSHDFTGHFVEQEFMPDKLINKVFYTPSNNATESKTLHSLREKWKKYYK
jgi:putative ATPase